MTDNQRQDGAALIAAERERQVTAEGWTPEHDDHHPDGSIAMAGAAYALVATSAFQDLDPDAAYGLWPWHVSWWKPSDDPVKNLVRAGALIAAEIDRIQREETNP